MAEILDEVNNLNITSCKLHSGVHTKHQKVSKKKITKFGCVMPHRVKFQKDEQKIAF